MRDEDKFVELVEKKKVINKLQSEVDAIETEMRKTFSEDVFQFFLDKGYEFEEVKSHYSSTRLKFKILRQVDKKSTFKQGYEPSYVIDGKNKLIVRFEWWLQKNGTSEYTSMYWYPEKQTLDTFYNKRLKKYVKLSLKTERKQKIEKLNSNEV
jgi:hypothetical protein